MKPGDDHDLPALRVCPHCQHEFHSDGQELVTRLPIRCPKCGKSVPFSPSQPDPLQGAN